MGRSCRQSKASLTMNLGRSLHFLWPFLNPQTELTQGATSHKSGQCESFCPQTFSLSSKFKFLPPSKKHPMSGQIWNLWFVYIGVVLCVNGEKKTHLHVIIPRERRGIRIFWPMHGCPFTLNSAEVCEFHCAWADPDGIRVTMCRTNPLQLTNQNATIALWSNQIVLALKRWG